MCPLFRASVVMASTSGSCVEQKQRKRQARASVEHVAVEQQRRRAAHDQKQSEERHQLDKARHAGEQRVDVELHPANYKEERNEHAERYRRELRVERQGSLAS